MNRIRNRKVNFYDLHGDRLLDNILTSYSLLVKNLIRTCLRYLKFTSSSLELLCLAVTVLDELGLRMAADGSASLSSDDEGTLNSR